MARTPIAEVPRLEGFKRLIIISSLALIINVATFILHLALLSRKHLHVVYSPAVLGTFAALLSLSSTIVDYSLWKEELTSNKKRWPRLRSAVKQLIFLGALSSVIAALAITTQQVEGLSSDIKDINYFDGSTISKVAIATFSCLLIISNAALLTAVNQLSWSPAHRAARSSMTIASLILFVIGTLLITVNVPRVGASCSSKKRSLANMLALHQHLGAIISATAVLGFTVCCAIREGNRMNQLFAGFIRFYVLLCTFSALLCISTLSFTLDLFFKGPSRLLNSKGTPLSDPILVGLALFLILLSLIAAIYLREPPHSHLAVEVIDLADLTPPQRNAYARLITEYGKLVPEAPSGEAAISLMQAYAGSSLPNMKCSVLRIYKPPKQRQKPSEDDRAWQHLDEEQMVLREIVRKDPSPIKPDSPPKLSRYQQKKLARKQASSANTAAESVASPDKAPDALDLEFIAKLESTEALVLMTTIEDYDLTNFVSGWPGRLLKRTLGSKAYWSPLCVRLGLLAFHWPFRESTFYCSYARRPVARSAAVLRAITQWNQSQPKSKRCSVLLDPTYQHEAAERAIVPSGWLPTPLPSSHVIDLRPHKGKTLAEYLKAINYRDQGNAFRKAGGEVIETGAFTAEECADELRLWRQIAQKRTAGGETGVLATPDEAFIMQLGAGGTNDRTLLFLKAGGHVVASCVLFRLGDTITSDLQGLDYERAYPLKAYFVMMQHVIGIALREGRSFVDFGPTTSKPKTDIGAKSVPLIGAMHALSPIISIAISIAARRTRQKLRH